MAENLRTLQRCILDIALEFKRICEKNNLKYFLAYGSLLGAVRHGGFIPWDDDMDVGMPRADYEKFLTICESELGDEFFFQTCETDKGHGFGYAKIRLNGTVMKEDYAENSCQHNGIFLDIFPYDAMPEKQFTVKLMRFQGEEDLFAERFKDFQNLKFEYADTHEDLVRGCEVLVSAATYLPEDVCPDDCFDEGVLVVPIHTLGFTNCDLFFDKIYADDFGHVHHFKNFDKFKYFSEVTDVLLGNTKGRENDKERILAYNIGLSIHDINFASRIYAMLCDNEKIKDVDMCAPKDKFWI